MGEYVLRANAGLDAVAPQVVDVLVRGRQWRPAFLDHLASQGRGVGGFSIPAGDPAQLLPAPWTNVNELVVRFSEEVLLDSDAMRLEGWLGPDGVDDANTQYALGGFSSGFGPTGDFEAVWSLNAELAIDRLRVTIDGTSNAAIVDVAGNPLDGEWTDGVSSYPSGDQRAGGDFVFGLAILAGDIDRDGFVVTRDVLEARLAMGSFTGGSAYEPDFDLNADGFVTSKDVLAARSRLGAFLPSDVPPAQETPQVESIFDALQSEQMKLESTQLQVTIAPASAPAAPNDVTGEHVRARLEDAADEPKVRQPVRHRVVPDSAMRLALHARHRGMVPTHGLVSSSVSPLRWSRPVSLQAAATGFGVANVPRRDSPPSFLWALLSTSGADRPPRSVFGRFALPSRLP